MTAVLAVLAAIGALSALSAAAVWWFYHQGLLLYYGDAQAHLNIARRIIDSLTPGYAQIGTVWLPLPHVLMLPFVGDDFYWRTGLAGAFPAAACFVVGGAFLFAAVRRAFDSYAAAITATAVFALNPNLLYLQSTSMTEAVFYAALLGLLYFTVLFEQTQSVLAVMGAGMASAAASMTRYEGWFLIPVATIYILLAAKQRRVSYAVLFGAIASLAPLYWLAHNHWYYGNVLEFYNGPYSAKAIYQRALDDGMARYPGDGDWGKAVIYYLSAAHLCVGMPLAWLGLAGAAGAILKRRLWPLILLALPPVFFVLSMHSSGTPIFVPDLWPNSYYNTRYGLAVLPLLAFAAGAAAATLAQWPRFRIAAPVLLTAAAVSPWLLEPSREAWVCWKESEVNSVARRAWTRQAADFLKERYRPGSRLILSFGDLTGIPQLAGIPLAEVIHEGNEPEWWAAVARPELFLRAEWAVAISGDRVASAMQKTERTGPHYRRVKLITEAGGPVIEIYRRTE